MVGCGFGAERPTDVEVELHVGVLFLLLAVVVWTSFDTVVWVRVSLTYMRGFVIVVSRRKNIHLDILQD